MYKKLSDNTSTALRALIMCAYASHAMAIAAVLFEVGVVLSLLTVLCIVSTFLYVLKFTKKLSFALDKQFEDANKIVRIHLIVCIGVYFVLVALTVSGFSLSPRTSISFATLGIMLMFGCWRVYNSLSLDYFDVEISKLEEVQGNTEEQNLNTDKT